MISFTFEERAPNPSISDIISLIITARYQIEVPDDLRHVLANDWDLVVHQKYLFKVPAKVTTY